MVDGRVKESFCCVKCAQEWPQAVEGGYWRVRDEVTGQILDAATACYVESSVVTVPSRQDKIHIFKGWAHAMDHAVEYGGTRIGNPLARSFSPESPSPEISAPPRGSPPHPSPGTNPGNQEKSP